MAERQSKLLLEVKIRREMAEAMFRQLLETEEAWRQVILQSSRLKGFHIHKCIHLYIYTYVSVYICMYMQDVYSCYLEKLGLDSFKASDEKGRRNIKINLYRSGSSMYNEKVMLFSVELFSV